jgi:hypothetical protein
MVYRMPVTSNWWNAMAEGTWKGKFLAKTFGMFYQDLLEPYFEKIEGYRVIAGDRNKKTGRRTRPAIYDYGKKKKYGNYDFLLEKNGKYYVAATKYWPNFDAKYTKSTPQAVKKAYPFFYSFDPKKYWAKVGNNYYPISGKVLFWWNKTSTPQLRKNWFYAIYSIPEAIYKMANHKVPAYNSWYNHYKSWYNDFFSWFQPATKASSRRTSTRTRSRSRTSGYKSSAHKTRTTAKRSGLRIARSRRISRPKSAIKRTYRPARRKAAA